MDVDKILSLICTAGEIMLKNGAEIYRVEDTTSRLCASYGFFNINSFAMPSIIFLNVSYGNKNYSAMRRVTSRQLNLQKVIEINNLSRGILDKPLSIKELEIKINNIENNNNIKNYKSVFFSALAACGFTLLFKGSFVDAFISFFIGFILKIFQIIFTSKINYFMGNIFSGALVSLIAIISFLIIPGINYNVVIIGSVVLLLPGIAITNSIRDTLTGDFSSGLSRAVEAIVIGVSIAVGTGFILTLFKNILGGKIL